MTFDTFFSLITEADTWISGFIFPDNHILYSTKSSEHHGDLIFNNEDLFLRYFQEKEFTAETIENALHRGKMWLFKNRGIVPFAIHDGVTIHFDVTPSPKQKQAVEAIAPRLVRYYGKQQNVHL